MAFVRTMRSMVDFFLLEKAPKHQAKWLHHNRQKPQSSRTTCVILYTTRAALNRFGLFQTTVKHYRYFFCIRPALRRRHILFIVVCILETTFALINKILGRGISGTFRAMPRSTCVHLSVLILVQQAEVGDIGARVRVNMLRIAISWCWN